MNESHESSSVHYQDTLTIPQTVIDQNGHVNNVAYVQWMQDLAVSHWIQLGGMEINQEHRATWVARSHWIEYLQPSFAGEVIIRDTWIADIGRVRSKRKYSFRRNSDQCVIARGETVWVFVDAKTLRPMALDNSIRARIPIEEN